MSSLYLSVNLKGNLCQRSPSNAKKFIFHDQYTLAKVKTIAITVKKKKKNLSAVPYRSGVQSRPRLVGMWRPRAAPCRKVAVERGRTISESGGRAMLADGGCAVSDCRNRHMGHGIHYSARRGWASRTPHACQEQLNIPTSALLGQPLADDVSELHRQIKTDETSTADKF